MSIGSAKRPDAMSITAEGQTPIPNWWFDQFLRQGSCARMKVTAAVIRYTLGTDYAEVKMSNSFLGWCTGEGQEGVNRGIKEAISSGFIVRRRFENEWAYRVLQSGPLTLIEDVYRPGRKGEPVDR